MTAAIEFAQMAPEGTTEGSALRVAPARPLDFDLAEHAREMCVRGAAQASASSSWVQSILALSALGTPAFELGSTIGLIVRLSDELESLQKAAGAAQIVGVLRSTASNRRCWQAIEDLTICPQPSPAAMIAGRWAEQHRSESVWEKKLQELSSSASAVNLRGMAAAQSRRTLSCADVALFDEALLASMKVIHEGELGEG